MVLIAVNTFNTRKKNCLELKKIQNVLDHTPYDYRNNQYNLCNEEINYRFLRECPIIEKLMKYNAYDQELIMNDVEYSFFTCKYSCCKT